MPDIISNHPPEKTYKVSLIVDGFGATQHDTGPWTMPEIKELKNMLANPEKRGTVTINNTRIFPISQIIAVDYKLVEKETN